MASSSASSTRRAASISSSENCVCTFSAAVLKAAPNAEAAKEFLAYLQTDKAMTVFEGVGFSAV